MWAGGGLTFRINVFFFMMAMLHENYPLCFIKGDNLSLSDVKKPPMQHESNGIGHEFQHDTQEERINLFPSVPVSLLLGK